MFGVKKYRRSAVLAVSCGMLGLFGSVGQGQQQNQNRAADAVQPPPAAETQTEAQANAEADVEVLTHGPVHEAFAGPLATDLSEGLIVPEAPPEPIDELPPEQMPEGAHVEWIPGYWGWDDERDDFLWISGLWRNVPPQQRWVPGYWADVDNGYRWVSGFWTEASVNQLDYLPYPPESQEYGPNIAAPGPDYFWVPGSWVYVSGEYQWQPGYWAPAYDDWCWIPQRYTWTPLGVIYSPGYWDYRVPNRGTLFAPVYFGNRGYYRSGYRFTPGYVINPAGLLVSLFVRPSYRHYYFGDYFDQRYRNRGFRPWYDASFDGGYYYDPLLAFYESYYDRRGVDFSGRIGRWHEFYRENPDRRPPRTLQETIQFARNNQSDSNMSQLILARSINELADTDRRDRQGRWNFRDLSADQRSELGESFRSLRELAENRGRVETRRETSPDQARQPDRETRQPNRETRQPDRETRQPDRETRPPDRETRPPGDRPERSEQGRTRGRLQLPEITRPERTLPGQRPGERAADEANRQRGRSNQPTPDIDDARQRRSNFDQLQRPDRLSRPEPPANRDDLRQRSRQLPGADRGTQPPTNRQRNQIERPQPMRNMLQPRRGNFPDINRGNQQARPQRPQVDPRESIPNPGANRGRGGGDPRGALNRPQQRERGAENPGNRGGNRDRDEDRNDD